MKLHDSVFGDLLYRGLLCGDCAFGFGIHCAMCQAATAAVVAVKNGETLFFFWGCLLTGATKERVECPAQLQSRNLAPKLDHPRNVKTCVIWDLSAFHTFLRNFGGQGRCAPPLGHNFSLVKSRICAQHLHCILNQAVAKWQCLMAEGSA
eukprot:2079777-Amphidinium_carterae.1